MLIHDDMQYKIGQTRIGSPFSEQSTIHMFFRALVIATYKNFNYVDLRMEMTV
jgi:hypothetical protein